MSNSEERVSQPLKIAGIEIPVAEQTPLVLALVAVIQRQAEEIQELRDEIQRMKGTTLRPKIGPSRLLEELKELGIDISHRSDLEHPPSGTRGLSRRKGRTAAVGQGNQRLPALR